MDQHTGTGFTGVNPVEQIIVDQSRQGEALSSVRVQYPTYILLEGCRYRQAALRACGTSADMAGIYR